MPSGAIIGDRGVKTYYEVPPSVGSFYLFGPTCDGLDYMKGPFRLPGDMGEGDYIEIGQTGAYGATMRTRFNGFYSDETAILTDEPLLSLYQRTQNQANGSEIHDQSGTEQ